MRKVYLESMIEDAVAEAEWRADPHRCPADTDSCDVCAQAYTAGKTARREGRLALAALRAGRLAEARRAVQAARQAEIQYGGGHAWRPVLRDIERVGALTAALVEVGSEHAPLVRAAEATRYTSTRYVTSRAIAESLVRDPQARARLIEGPIDWTRYPVEIE